MLTDLSILCHLFPGRYQQFNSDRVVNDVAESNAGEPTDRSEYFIKIPQPCKPPVKVGIA